MTRSEQATLKAYPPTYTTVKRHAKRVQSERTDTHLPARAIFQQGYERAEKDMIEKAAKWIRARWREYIWGPDADGCIGFGLWENDFRKAMEEE